MRIVWILFASLGASLADLPSCSRARCSHCDVNFIAKMCQATCASCPRTVTDSTAATKLRVFPEENRTSLIRGPVKANKPNTILRQAGVPTQTQRQAPVQHPNVQFAAPQSQVPAIQYPQQGMSTLAPLIAAPRPTDISSQLASQPADLAQPLPEYQNMQQTAYNVQQQPQQYQPQAQQTQSYYNTNQNTFQQQPTLTDAYGRPLYSTQQTQQQYTQQQQQTNAFNPFQPFLQQGNQGTPNLLDPFGLFNLGGMGNLAQGTSLTQVSPAPVPQPQPAAQPVPQGQTTYYGQQQPPQQMNYNQPAVQMPYAGQQQQMNMQPSQPYYNQNNYNQQQQQQLPAASQPAHVMTQQPVSMYQARTPQQLPAPQVQTALPRPQYVQNVDHRPLVVKYVDGKGPAPAPLPQQCPRQPGWAPCITKQQANERFTNCCARLGEGCLPLCNYDAPLATMQLAVLTGRCPLGKMADIMVCASGYEDATACCEAYNVFEPGYEQCRPYCNPAAGLPQGGLLSEKYKCLVKMSQIQQCFYVSQKP